MVYTLCFINDNNCFIHNPCVITSAILNIKKAIQTKLEWLFYRYNYLFFRGRNV